MITPDRPTLTLEAAVQLFLVTKTNSNTKSTYSANLRRFVTNYGPQRPLTSITPEDMDMWKASLHERHLKPATISSYVKEIKAFFNWCLERRYISGISPAYYLKAKKARHEIRSKAMPDDILEPMRNAVDEDRECWMGARDTAILAILEHYGARAGDIARLCLSDLLPGNQIRLHQKGEHENVLPLVEEVAIPLAAWVDVRETLDPDPLHDYLFVNVRTRPGYRYGPLKSASISSVIKRLSHRATGVTYGPHSLRHRRGVTLADQGVSPEVIATVLGHADIKTTLENYCGVTTARVRRALTMGRGVESKKPTPAKNGKILPFSRKLG